MSLTEQNNLFSVVMELQRTVQLLAEKVEGSVHRNGEEAGELKCTSRDDAVGPAEQGPGESKEAAVVLVEEKGNLAKKGVAFAEPVVHRREAIGMTFGGFSGRVPLVGADRQGILDIGSDSGSVSSSLIEAEVSSWADLMDAEEAGGSQGVGFQTNLDDKARFYRDFVRTAEVKDLRGFLSSKGVVVRKSCWEELSLSRYTAATVPDAFLAGRVRLKSLALLGDKVMSAVAVEKMYMDRRSAADIQGFLARTYTRTALSPICVNSGLGRYIIAPGGVDLGKTSVGGEALEAVAGVVFHSGGFEAVKIFLQAMQLL